jgi:hypothetical protein
MMEDVAVSDASGDVLDRMDNADAGGDVVPVTLFRVDMGVTAEGQIAGLSLHWNGAAVQTTEFAAGVLNEVKKQLDDVGVVHRLLMTASVAAFEAAKAGVSEAMEDEEHDA